ncbi:DedA family protein [Candidatus Saccharibacteria bacterium]|nr:DedA family protein [Candidatus Saccharibacteria bacterium]NCU40344.1 DedA family protein [Candidatus Saccharibacteria bacterium]
MEALIHFITGFGIFAILFVIFAESGLLVGFFLPGDSLLFTSGFLVQQAEQGSTFGINVNIHLFVILLFLAAVLGDNTGYAFGHRVGRKLFERPNSKFFKKHHLEQAESFYQKYGGKAIVLARFVPIVRTFAPIVAGASKMHYRKFLAYNIVGGLLWTTLFTYLGYYVGKELTDMGINIEIIAIIIILLSVAPMFIHALSDQARREKIWSGTKHQLKILFKKK